MLWVYINNQGVAECVVNVGNKIRQGDAIKLFICLEGQQSQSALYQVNRVAYLKPTAKEFISTDVTIAQNSHEFKLGDPSQANSYFTANNPDPYIGYDVYIPSDATNFDANGGHVAFEIVLINPSTGEYLHAQTVSTYVEPTFGKHGNKITSQDYSTLVDMLRLSNFQYYVPMTADAENGVTAIVDNELLSPVLVIGETMGFVRGALNVDTTALVDDAQSTSEDEENDGYATMAYISVASADLVVNANFVGRDNHGNDIRMRVNGADGASINVDANISDLRQSGDDDIILSYFGTCPVLNQILDFSSIAQEGVVEIINATATSEAVASDYSGELVTVTVERLPSDPSKGFLAFSFKIPRGERGSDGTDGVDGRAAGFNEPSINVNVTTLQSGTTGGGSGSISQQGPDHNNNYTLGFNFDLQIPKGADGVVTTSGGALGFQVDPTTGQLILFSSDGGDHGLHLVSDDPTSPDYYVTLGVPSSMVGHMVLIA